MISIIIPHYNASSKLINNLNELDKQTSKNFEVIIVDDYSNENEYEVLKSLEFTYNIFLYRNEANYGPGFSRNMGIKKAKGDYITFLDADDTLDINLVDKIENIVKMYDIDAVAVDYFYVNGSLKFKRSMFSSKNIKSGFVDKKTALVYINGSTMGKIYKTSILKEKNIEFLTTKMNEDMPFTKKAISYCEHIYYLAMPYYNYINNPNSLMNNRTLDNEINTIFARDNLKESLENRFPKELNSILNYEYVYSIILTKINLNREKKEIMDFINHNPIILSDYDKEYPTYVKIVLYLIKHKLYYLLKILSLAKRYLKKWL